MKKLTFLFSFSFFWLLGCMVTKKVGNDNQPNVLLIMVDDLNDHVGVLNGHPQSYTPNMDKLAQSGVSFLQAYTNAPMCGPSRASLFAGIYPHHSNNYFQQPWHQFEVLNNTRTIMEQFKLEGYQVLGTGKILHHNKKELWTHFENEADYTPTPFDGIQQVPHPDVPKPFSDIGWVDGSFGPFINLTDRTTPEGRPLHWTTGNAKKGFKTMQYFDDDNRDPTPDEINATWTANKIKELANNLGPAPFFLAVGFLRPHTPLVAPQKYFDRFPLNEIQLVDFKKNDTGDTHLQAAYQGDVFTLRMGKDMFEAISKAYGSKELGLKKWTQAYLACVTAVDDNIGQVMEALDNSPLKENTIVILASDHGFHSGEKDYLYKNSLWEESTRIPLLMRVPNVTKAGRSISQVVSLIDIYPTLLDLCELPTTTRKNEKGHALDGRSLVPLLKKSTSKNWNGKALTVVFAGNDFQNDPTQQHYAIRNQRYRYILYNNGQEELYDHESDPNEWENIAKISPGILGKMRKEMAEIIAPVQLVGFEKLVN